jgi:AbiEi antitoxin C-terminal domain
MWRPLTPGLSPVGEVLAREYGQGDLLTLDDLEGVVRRAGVPLEAKVVASRLLARGWLQKAGPRAVYTFAPEPTPSVPDRPDPVVALRAALLRRPELQAALTLRSAAWAYGLADHSSSRLELSAPTRAQASALSAVGRPFVFAPRLGRRVLQEVPVLQAESLLVHMASKPADVRHWAIAMGWLPPLAATVRLEAVCEELQGRTRPVAVRLGYLLSAVRPDVADALRPAVGAWVPFGTAGRVRRVDPEWHVADSLLPVSPRLLESAAGPS